MGWTIILLALFAQKHLLAKILVIYKSRDYSINALDTKKQSIRDNNYTLSTNERVKEVIYSTVRQGHKAKLEQANEDYLSQNASYS